MLLFSQKTAKIDDCNFQMHVMSILNILNLCELLLIQPLRDTENTRSWAAHVKKQYRTSLWSMQ